MHVPSQVGMNHEAAQVLAASLCLRTAMSQHRRTFLDKSRSERQDSKVHFKT